MVNDHPSWRTSIYGALTLFDTESVLHLQATSTSCFIKTLNTLMYLGCCVQSSVSFSHLTSLKILKTFVHSKSFISITVIVSASSAVDRWSVTSFSIADIFSTHILYYYLTVVVLISTAVLIGPDKINLRLV